MKIINSRELNTDRLDLRVPTIKEQKRLWEVLCMEEVNRLYFPTPDRYFRKNNLNPDSLEDAKKARVLFLKDLNDWDRQSPFYEKKIEKIKEQDDSQKFTWSIFLKDTDIVIGQVTCQEKDGYPNDRRDVGWYIDPAYHRNGYASEAASAMIDYMFNEVEISEILTSAEACNEGSWKIMDKLGMEYTGNYLSSYFDDDKFLECKSYHITREMYLNKNKGKELKRSN